MSWCKKSVYGHYMLRKEVREMLQKKGADIAYCISENKVVVEVNDSETINRIHYVVPHNVKVYYHRQP